MRGSNVRSRVVASRPKKAYSDDDIRRVHRQPVNGGVSGAVSPSLEERGARRLPAATGNGNPRTARRPWIWFSTGQFVTHAVGGFATSVASAPVTMPMRPPLATSQIDMPPQWSFVSLRPSVLVKSGPQLACGMRVATCALSRTTNLAERPLPMFTRGVTRTQ